MTRSEWLVSGILMFVIGTVVSITTLFMGDSAIFFIIVTTLILSWIGLASTTKRLRDAGSPIPIIEAILGTVIIGLGTIWLLIRCLFFPSKDAKASTRYVEQSHQTTSKRPVAKYASTVQRMR